MQGSDTTRVLDHSPFTSAMASSSSTQAGLFCSLPPFRVLCAHCKSPDLDLWLWRWKLTFRHEHYHPA